MRPSRRNRHRWMRYLGTGLLLLTAAWGCDRSGAATAPTGGDDPGGFGILFIGNSLTYWNDMPSTLGRLLREHGGVDSLRIRVVALPDFGLQDHWASQATRAAIAEGSWDIVIMQQGPSASEGRPSLLEYTARFAEVIRQNGGQPAVYMVWPSLLRYSDLDAVSESHQAAARAIDGLLFPAGEAWRIVMESNPGDSPYGPDGFHPSQLGSYLVALVMYEQLSGRDPRELPAVIPTRTGDVAIDEDVASRLQTAAVSANQQFALP